MKCSGYMVDDTSTTTALPHVEIDTDGGCEPHEEFALVAGGSVGDNADCTAWMNQRIVRPVHFDQGHALCPGKNVVRMMRHCRAENRRSGQDKASQDTRVLRRADFLANFGILRPPSEGSLGTIPMLKEWESFYVIVGSSAVALIGSGIHNAWDSFTCRAVTNRHSAPGK